MQQLISSSICILIIIITHARLRNTLQLIGALNHAHLTIRLWAYHLFNKVKPKTMTSTEQSVQDKTYFAARAALCCRIYRSEECTRYTNEFRRIWWRWCRGRCFAELVDLCELASRSWTTTTTRWRLKSDRGSTPSNSHAPAARTRTLVVAHQRLDGRLVSVSRQPRRRLHRPSSHSSPQLNHNVIPSTISHIRPPRRLTGALTHSITCVTWLVGVITGSAAVSTGARWHYDDMSVTCVRCAPRLCTSCYCCCCCCCCAVHRSLVPPPLRWCSVPHSWCFRCANTPST